MDCSLPHSSVRGIFQARVLEWGAISFSRGSSRPRDWTQVSRIVGRRFTIWATREVIVIQLHTPSTVPGSSVHGILQARILKWVSQFSSVAQSYPTLWAPWTAALQASLSITNSRSLLKHRSIDSVMPEVGIHSFLQGIFLTQRSNPGLLHYGQILYCLSYQGS